LNKRHPNLADKKECVLIIIDVQDKLFKHIYNQKKLSKNIQKLIKTSQLFDIPIIIVEQEKLGKTIPEIRQLLGKSYQPISKIVFSCFKNKTFKEKLKQVKKKTCILVGIENHICINQTAHDLLENGYKVHVVEDAISSRNKMDIQSSIDKMRYSGIVITSTEMIMYELMEKSDDNIFKQFLEIVKSN
jgi:nicotinamidase-related amidase